MCGILGVRRSSFPDRARAERALTALAWRGPDGQRLVEAGDWFLGVARLAITAPARDQPVTCPTTGRIALFNGAVTSARREWRQTGGADDGNDAELVLRRLQRGGPRALAATCGPYALAVVDPVRDELWLGRDPEGEKPLFVAMRGDQVVAFASSVAALRVLGLDLELDRDDVARLLRYGFALPRVLHSGDLTVHGDLRGAYTAHGSRGLRAVPAAHAPPETASFRRFGDRVAAAAERCATAAVPVGLCLSGGVDSSCLAAALARRGHRGLPAYQFRARGADGEERRRAERVAAATGMTLRPVDGGVEVLEALAHLTRCTGLPQGDPSVLASHALARAARADGVRVLLGGEGADDLWLGYRRHRAAALLPARGWRELPAPPLGTGTAARLLRAMRAPSPYDVLLEVMPPGFARAVLVPGALPVGELPGADAPVPALERARFVDREFYLRHDLLPKCDTALMAAGVEGRCPYLDPEVLAAPETRRADPRAVLGKRALKDAFRAALPAGILDRRKRGFGLPLDRWLRDSDALADLLCDQRTAERAHLRADGLGTMLDRHRRGRVKIGHALYLVAAYEVYLRYLEEAA